jgi:hypothetical protein
MNNRSGVLQIAVVGHTNTGKTSLLRTLTRDVNFGEVADAPGTTKQVQGAQVKLEGNLVMVLFDTPGIEDSMGLLDYLEQLSRPGGRLDGPERLELFLRGPEASGRYEQEARVLTKLLDCQVGLYVIDVREPVLAKHKDELLILASCGRPLLPILNFVASTASRAAQWRATLSRLGLHTCIEFDSVSPPLDGEETLYRTLSIVLPSHQATLAGLQLQSAKQKVARRVAGMTLIAGLLIDLAALRTPSSTVPELLEQAIIQQQAVVRQREQACVQALLLLFQFREDDYLTQPLPLSEGSLSVDLFNPQALKDIGVHTGGGLGAGMIAGAVADVLSAGLTLGTGMLIGAVAGGAAIGVGKFGTRMLSHMRGYRELTVDDQILQFVRLRQRQLLAALERRGHAAIAKIDVAETTTIIKNAVAQLPKPMQRARLHPEWSAVGDRFHDSSARQKAILALVEHEGLDGEE